MSTGGLFVSFKKCLLTRYTFLGISDKPTKKFLNNSGDLFFDRYASLSTPAIKIIETKNISNKIPTTHSSTFLNKKFFI